MTLLLYHEIKLHTINQQNADIILKVISDLQQRKIITCINNKAKTVKRISEETGVTISTTYRKINDLKRKNMLILSGNIIKNKREFRYQSKIRKVVIEFEDKIDVKIYTNN